MAHDSFFDESTEQSQIKSRIVAKYFWAWAKVMIATVKQRGQRLAYIDLFAGPGRYEDGTPSTPLLVLQRAISEPEMAKILITIFNDKIAENARKLRIHINALPE